MDNTSLAKAVAELIATVDCLSRDQSIGFQRTMSVRASLDRARAHLREQVSKVPDAS